MADFKRDFAGPIKKGLQKHAKFKLKMNAIDQINTMKRLYRPHFLRRTKKEIFSCKSSELQLRPLEWNELPFKTDLVVWIPLTQV